MRSIANVNSLFFLKMEAPEIQDLFPGLCANLPESLYSFGASSWMAVAKKHFDATRAWIKEAERMNHLKHIVPQGVEPPSHHARTKKSTSRVCDVSLRPAGHGGWS